MSTTPRTDARELAISIQNEDSCCAIYVKVHGKEYEGGLVDTDFARELERELAETRKALEESMSHQRELRADRDRLDWLDSCGDVCSDLTGKYNWKEWLVSTINSSMKLDASIRSAIDSEMKLTKEENEN
jgi:hypothetical protein